MWVATQMENNKQIMQQVLDLIVHWSQRLSDPHNEVMERDTPAVGVEIQSIAYAVG